MKIMFDEDTSMKEVYTVCDNDLTYKEALEKFKELIKDSNNSRSIADSVFWLETVVTEVIYKKAFHDGMKFIIDTMAGKEVIEI